MSKTIHDYLWKLRLCGSELMVRVKNNLGLFQVDAFPDLGQRILLAVSIADVAVLRIINYKYYLM